MTFVRLEDMLTIEDDESGVVLHEYDRDRERVYFHLTTSEGQVPFTSEAKFEIQEDGGEVARYKILVFGTPPYMGGTLSRDDLNKIIDSAVRGWVQTMPANKNKNVSVHIEFEF